MENIKQGKERKSVGKIKEKRSSIIEKSKINTNSLIKIKEVKQEDDYAIKVDKLRNILENKNKPKTARKRTFLSKSKYKLIVSIFGIAIVIYNY